MPPKSSAWVATAVPSLPTTMPAARLAMRIAASMPAPAASMTARVAITVSPAPVTSNTSASRATAGIVVVLLLANKVIPCSPRRAHPRCVGWAALCVSGQDHHVAVGQRALEFLELGREHLARRRFLEVDAQQLLLAADDAELLRRVELAVAVQARLDAFLLDQLLELPARLVAPHHREQACVRA